MKLTPCPKCKDGWLQYRINRDVFTCSKCSHEEPWTQELDDRFNNRTELTEDIQRIYQ